MIIKGITEQAKISVNYVQNFFYIPYSSKAQNCTTRCLAKTLDFNLIDYLVCFFTMNTDNGAGSLLQIDIDGSTEWTNTVSDGESGCLEIDCTSITGEVQLEIIINASGAGNECYLTNWGFYPSEETTACIA